MSLFSSDSSGVRLIKTSDINNEKVSLISDVNTSMCGQVEIFDAIAAIGEVDAVGSDRKSTAIGQLRRHLELENQKLHSQSGKIPQGVST